MVHRRGFLSMLGAFLAAPFIPKLPVVSDKRARMLARLAKVDANRAYFRAMAERGALMAEVYRPGEIHATPWVHLAPTLKSGQVLFVAQHRKVVAFTIVSERLCDQWENDAVREFVFNDLELTLSRSYADKGIALA